MERRAAAELDSSAAVEDALCAPVLRGARGKRRGPSKPKTPRCTHRRQRNVAAALLAVSLLGNLVPLLDAAQGSCVQAFSP